MRDITTTILELGNKLDLDERTVVAHKLLEALHEGSDSDTDVETAWQVELRHQIDDIENGRIELVSHTETVALARNIASGSR